MLNAIPHCHGSGPARIIIYDIHALAVQHFHSDGIILDLQSCLPLLFKYTQTDNVVYAFPDEGAAKRFGETFKEKGLPTVVCSKVRDGDKVTVTLKDSALSVKSKDVIIIDDMLRGGGTLENCRQVISDCGARTVGAFVTHCVCPKWTVYKAKKFFNKFDNFYTTDTCQAGRIFGHLKPKFIGKSFKMLSISDLIYKDLNQGA